MRAPYLVLPLLGAWTASAFGAEPKTAQFRLAPAALSHNPGVADPVLSELARAVLARYRSDDRQAYLDTLFRLQDLAGRPRASERSLLAFGVFRRSGGSPRQRAYNSEFLVYERARIQERRVRAFSDAYRRAFRNTFEPLNDRDAANALSRFQGADIPAAARALARARADLNGKTRIGLDEAVTLLRASYALKVARASDSLSRRATEEEDRRRWIIQRNVRIPVGQGASVCALIVRPRSAPRRAPGALQFTIYADPDSIMREARRSAGYGYAGVIGLTRGKGCSPNETMPYEHDGKDADTLISWIARQDWSDGQVGLYGGSYSGFTAWAALKSPPKALKAIYVGAPASPGLDVPMEGNIPWMFAYPWPFYTTDNKSLDNEIYGDTERWGRLQKNWYSSGRAFKELDRIDGKPNPIWNKWMAHPSYDGYWKSTQPTDLELRSAQVPVLQTAGYYYGGPGAAVPYLQRLERLNPAAQSYLLIGPYDHFQAQTGFFGSLVGESDKNAGLTMDPAARVDLVDLRFAWFDHFMKGGPMPSIVKDRINYQVVGANVWKHAPTIAAMGPARLRYHLSADAQGTNVLAETFPATGPDIELNVDLADRRDADDAVPPDLVLSRELSSSNALTFTSVPLSMASEASGLFSGHLEFVTNKKDFDLEIDLYERTVGGDFIQLAQWWMRASYATDLSTRRLLTPGVTQTIDFRSIRLMSRQLAKGSRIVALLRVVKGPDRQINYGTGKPVDTETIADGVEPLLIKFSRRSFIELPIMPNQ